MVMIICKLLPLVKESLIHLLCYQIEFTATLAVTLCNDETFLNVVAQCASRDTVIGLCAEARRLTASLIKHSQSSGMNLDYDFAGALLVLSFKFEIIEQDQNKWELS